METELTEVVNRTAWGVTTEIARRLVAKQGLTPVVLETINEVRAMHNVDPLNAVELNYGN